MPMDSEAILRANTSKLEYLLLVDYQYYTL